jgi:ATP-dependent Lhr-like helicase
MTAVDRLVRLSGFSASLSPRRFDRWKGGRVCGRFRLVREDGNLGYTPRPISILRSDVRKEYDLHVSFSDETGWEQGRSVWDPLVDELKKIIARNRSTLVFVNSRRLCEMLTLMINQGEEEPIAYAHHGSLALEIRSEVERRLKAGALRAIVATHSLELGIDIGALDEVVLIQSPFSVSSAIQRVGRSRHQVGEMSRGTCFPIKDVEAAVLSRS